MRNVSLPCPFHEDFLQKIEGAMHAGGGFNRAMLSGDAVAVKAKYAANEQRRPGAVAGRSAHTASEYDSIERIDSLN